MGKKSFKEVIFILLFLFIFAISTTLVLADNKGDVIDDYQKENTYVFALEKDVNTTINGDLFLLSAESNIQGTINRDLNAISGKINVQGIIGDDLRLVASEANINVYVFNELRILSDKITTSDTTIVKGKTTIRASDAIIKGVFYDSVKIRSDKIYLDAIFEGDLELTGKKITINPETRIRGNLVLPEGTELPENIVSGEVTFQERKYKTVSTRELLLTKITMFLMIVILAGVLHLVSNKKTNEFIETSTKRPLLALIIGLLSIFVLPILSLFSFVTIITAPLGILVLLILLALLVVAPALGALLIGKQILGLIRSRRAIRLEILIGALFLIFLSFIPGFLLVSILLLYSLFVGTIIMAFAKVKKNNKKKKKK